MWDQINSSIQTTIHPYIHVILYPALSDLSYLLQSLWALKSELDHRKPGGRVSPEGSPAAETQQMAPGHIHNFYLQDQSNKQRNKLTNAFI